MFDFSIFLTAEAWISLLTLIFLEIVLGVDNLVFISITTNRLPKEKQHIGRKLGLAGALIMRILFLCFASFLVHLTNPLFTIDLGAFSHGFSIRDIVMLAGGAYLIYKGIAELLDVLRLTEIKAEHSDEHKAMHMIGLPQAIGTIMVMDLVFSIDSVITAVGLAEHLIIMILAVMIAVILMMIFIDPISNFINSHPEMKILALCFITVIGILLVLDSAGINSGIEVLDMHAEKLMVYFAMVFAFILELIQMKFNSNFDSWRRESWAQDTETQMNRLRSEFVEKIEAERARREEAEEKAGKSSSNAHDEGAQASTSAPYQPIIIGKNVYVMMPMDGMNASEFKQLEQTAGDRGLLNAPIEIEAEYEIVDEPDAGAKDDAPGREA